MKQIKWDRCSKSQFMYSHLRYFKKLVKDQNISRFCFLFSFQMIKIKISFNHWEFCNSFLVFFLQLNHQELLWDLWTRRCFIFVPFLFWHCFQHCYLRRDSNIYINDVETLYINFFLLLWKRFFCDRDLLLWQSRSNFGSNGLRCTVQIGGDLFKVISERSWKCIFSFLEGNTQ